MPDTPTPSFASPRRQWPRLALLTLAVLLGHGVLLRAAPLALAAAPSSTAPMPLNAVWTTRTLPAADPLPPPAPQVLRAPAAPASPVRSPVPNVARTTPPAASAQNLQPITPLAHENTSDVAIQSIAPTPLPTFDASPIQLAQAQTTPVPPASAPSGAAIDPTSVRSYAIPSPMRLKYEVRGQAKHIPYTVNGELLWQHDATSYDARLEMSHFLLGSRVQTSKGLLTAQGLEPVRFGDKVRSEVAAHFERSKNKVSYSANTPDEVLQAGAQDQLSVFFQLAAMLGGAPQRFVPGTSIAFQAVGPRSSEIWVFKFGTLEPLDLPGGKIQALKLTKEPVNEADSRSELWLAPELDYLPVRIRLSQSNGDFVDQLWRATQKP